MKIARLQGLDRRLYELVAPLVMNPAILRQNNDYPFKTTQNHIWYIAMAEERVLGFMPVKKTVTGNRIDNYFVSGDDPSVIEALLDGVVDELGHQGDLTAIVHKRHVEEFAKKGFSTCVEWRKYDKMRYLSKG